jgi:hypothetical protein
MFAQLKKPIPHSKKKTTIKKINVESSFFKFFFMENVENSIQYENHFSINYRNSELIMSRQTDISFVGSLFLRKQQ